MRSIDKRVLTWAGLFCIAVVHVVSALSFHPVALFGRSQDDSIYFSSAKAIAEHMGYILPSVPGQPVATKYPILYPWLLSWVWRWNSSFPANLMEAFGLTLTFGVIFVVATYIFLSRLKGIGKSAALFLTLVTALHPIVLLYSQSVLSEIPFTALALLAMVTADKALSPEGSATEMAACGALTGLSLLVRAFGIPLTLGILAAALARRAWRRAAVFCAALVPFGAIFLRRAALIHPSAPMTIGGVRPAPGYLQAWIYYTSYLGFWKLSVPTLHIFWEMLKNNATLIFFSPANYFLVPLLQGDSMGGKALMLLVVAGVLGGIARQATVGGWRSIHWVLPFYMATILFWNFPDTSRFLLPFLPLFAAGLWLEAEQIWKRIRGSSLPGRNVGERALSLTLSFGIAALFCALSWNYVRGARYLMALGTDRMQLLQDKRAAYEWLSCCTLRNDVVVAYEDASLYLYSGRPSMRPVVFNTAGFYDPAYLENSFAHFKDIPVYTRARYWLISDDDFDNEWGAATVLGRRRETELMAGLPIRFQSPDGRVRIFELRCPGSEAGEPCPWTSLESSPEK